MKKMISKKLVSLLAAAAMLITSTAVVLADNVTTSESGDQWGTAGSTVGCAHSVEDGVLTSTRSVFRVDQTVDGTKYNKFYHAVGDKWALHSEKLSTASWSGYPNITETKWNVTTQTSTGKAQAKFDFKFDGGDNQRFYVYFKDYYKNSAGTSSGQTGLIVRKGGITPLKPNGIGVTASKTDYTFGNGVWYTCTLTLDLDRGVMDYSFSEKNSSKVLGGNRYTIDTSTDLGTTYNVRGSITGLVFRSPADSDYTDGATTMQALGDVAVAESVWHIANVEYDAYTETNYELNNVYKSTDGMVSNKASDSTPFAGVGLTRLTNIADPANASLITASYDANTRMENVAVTPLSSVTTTPVHSAVTGNTIKSFIFDMDTATPFVDAYQYTEPTVTERSIDFNEGCSVATTNDKSTITTQGNYLNSSYNDMVVGIENGALKFERKNFRQKAKITNDDGETVSNYNYCYTYGDEGIESFGTPSDSNGTNVSGPDYTHYVVRLGESTDSITGSLKFKFAGVDHPNGVQHITIGLGSGATGKVSTNVGQYFIRIMRKADGTGKIRNYFSDAISWGATETMSANEWYTLDFTYSYHTTAPSLTISLTGDFGGTTTTKTATVTPSSTNNLATFDFMAIYSHYNDDYAFPATEVLNPTTGWSTRTSVWYIDDINVKY